MSEPPYRTRYPLPGWYAPDLPFAGQRNKRDALTPTHTRTYAMRCPVVELMVEPQAR